MFCVNGLWGSLFAFTHLNLLIFWWSSSFPPIAVSPHASLPLSHFVCHLPPSLHVCLSIPFFSAFTLQRALHFTRTMDERLRPSAGADKTTRVCAHRLADTDLHTVQSQKWDDNRSGAHATLNTKLSNTRALVCLTAHQIWTCIWRKTPNTCTQTEQYLCRTHELKPLGQILCMSRAWGE